MKSLSILTATALLSTIGTFGTPAGRSTNEIVEARDVERSVDIALAPIARAAADENSWVCLLATSKRYAYATGTSEGDAGNKAENLCGGACSGQCVQYGCVGIANGGVLNSQYAIAIGKGAGASDREKASAAAVAACVNQGVQGCSLWWTECTATTI
jgi:hypothetical protein